ncbi:MAG: hypothetical protein A2312_04405 [Candidatus Staskawiczbacteria bacterium RIFOXYB2_FULL_32_9]|uniref:TrbC/VIRB2 family protein n=1 Tax=Candidatus Staskawiczbacteria bacterium RIFOXYD1_FULL_32_13 TaxID=1802234 RepID=A0A1G2JK71_9BACT|nr:MAG: hypothetical protein UR22_C0009G0007 [Parcubacteria group bacterium GW2011_GWC2_32_10]OGZ77479.1 MAG: hypothetical protein A2256_00950 [Candidatus Staskawiczbacteria bacterium RIFOXYA2_FULL_32_7]OGZ78756.1 MAG: hypothetical protein A2360_01050 [Candidatus Staskawiczbacteria bacterium RIFOXYB1_FULL_32_11]OGZ81864.1 MAG: hypothetical protein A2312_04405 [Candidatus Staskawiczbacteria bacterium RIFOXYB2_FULL_32_9]OGZ85317.1 MAG: hypothetical protein A2463_00835 [Candidatus Staskawiczbacter
MNKYILSLLISVILLSFSGSVLAVQIINPLGSTDTFCKLLTNLSTGIAGLVATLSGIMIIIAGILYLTSAGDQQKMTTAKTALKYAIIGIIVALLAIPIVEVIKEVLNVSVPGGC